MSQSFVVLSAEPDNASLLSGEMSVLRTHEECPLRVATAPDPGLPDGDTRTSCRMRRLSSDAESSSCSRKFMINQMCMTFARDKRTVESADHAKDRTAMACELYATWIELVATSKMKICPASEDIATREPSGLCNTYSQRSILDIERGAEVLGCDAGDRHQLKSANDPHICSASQTCCVR